MTEEGTWVFALVVWVVAILIPVIALVVECLERDDEYIEPLPPPDWKDRDGTQ